MAAVAERERRTEENRSTAKRIIEEQTQKEAATVNRSADNGDEISPPETSAVGNVEEKRTEDNKNKQHPTREVASGSEKAVVNAIAEMTFEEFKEIKRGRGRPPREEQKKKKNSQ